MIEIIGIPGSREFAAAESIREAFLATWPDLETTDKDVEHVAIAADVKIPGYRVTDIDVVVAGYLKDGRVIHPRKVLRDSDGNRLTGNPVWIENFVVAVEVKDHGPSAVRFVGDKVEVKYARGASKGWKSATDQNIDQLHSLRDYFSDSGLSPFVHRCLLMQGLDEVKVETAVAHGFSANDFFTAVCAGSPPRKFRGKYTLSSSIHDAHRLTSPRIFTPLMPTSLDRQRMDRILQKSPVVDQVVDKAGSTMLALRGHGGTGKTVTFLQSAYRRFKEQDERTVVLTYNHALAADIRRLLALLGIPSGVDGGISVQTAMSFFSKWLRQLHVVQDGQSLRDDYEKCCVEGVEAFREGLLLSADIEKVKAAEPEAFDYDLVMVDECQDWPPYEIELLKELYGSNSIVVADGMDQLVRGQRANWFVGLAKNERQLINLVKCLRMKRNLAVFAKALAEGAGVSLDVIENDQAGGGKIIVVKGDWAEHRALHEKLEAAAKDANNEPVDWLFCVPESSIDHDDRRHSDVYRALRQWGYECWDGVDPAIRKDFPRSTGEYRVVHYQSARGLEGWTVVLENLDQFWDERRTHKMRVGFVGDEEDSMASIEELADHYAWHWVFIALTRPIDTLVITLDDMASPFSRALERVAQRLPDVITWDVT